MIEGTDTEPAPVLKKAPKATKPVAAKDSVPEVAPKKVEADKYTPYKSRLRDDSDLPETPATHYRDTADDQPYGPYTKKEKTKYFIHPEDKGHYAK